MKQRLVFFAVCAALVASVLLATGVAANRTVVAVTNFGGAHQIWFRASNCVARSVDGGSSNFVADPAAAGTALSGSALYFPCAAGQDDAARQQPWWAEYQIDAADLGTLTLGGSWGIWCRATQPASNTVESDWIIVNGDPAFLNKSNPTEADWNATFALPNFSATPGGHVIVNNISTSGGTLFPYVWGWWSRASAAEIQHQPLKVIDGKLTFRIYEREAGTTNARIDLVCWSDNDSYKPTDADAAVAAGAIPWNLWGGTIHGTVRNANTMEAVPNATVTLPNGDSVTTDSIGAYTIVVPEYGPTSSYVLTASAFSFQTRVTAPVSVPNSTPVLCDITLVPIVNSIQGVVTDLSSTPIVGATVSVRSGTAPVLTATTIAGGIYSISVPALGTYNVTASAVGYVPKNLPAVVVAAPPATPTVNASLAPIGAPTQTITDNFPGPTLGAGWLTQSPDTTEDLYAWYPQEGSPDVLYLDNMYGHGISIAGFAPVNIDCTVRMGLMAGDAGITYRQTSPCTYDALFGAVAPAGYFVRCAADGTSVSLERNGVVLASAAPNITDWAASFHNLRVIAYGSHHWVLLDGMKLIDTTNADQLAGGYVGINRNPGGVALLSISASQLPAGGPTGDLATLTGTVTDAVTHAVLPGGAVQLVGGAYVNTNAGGTYTMNLASDELGVRQMTVYVSGYATQTFAVSLGVGTNTLNVAMTPDPCLVASPKAAKAKGSGCVTLLGQVMTAMWNNNTLYLEDPARTSGIKVVLSSAVSGLQSMIGQVAGAQGTLATDTNGEVYISSANLYQVPGVPATTNYLKPVFMTGKSILQPSGLDPTGLDVKIVGKVTATDWNSTNRTCSYFKVDDGSGEVRVDVDSSLCSNASPYYAPAFQGPTVGEYVEVEGIVSSDALGQSGRALRIWNPNGNLLLWNTGSWGYANGDFEGTVGTYNGTPAPSGWGWETNACFSEYEMTSAAPPVSHTGRNYIKLANCVDGRGTGQFGRFFGWFPSIPYQHNGPLTNQPLVGAEYVMSCYVKGTGIGEGSYFGFWDANMPADPYNASMPNAFRIPIPTGDIPDWTSIGGSFRYDGVMMLYGYMQTTDVFEYQVVLENVATELDVDDFYLGFARGTMHFISPTHYLHYGGQGALIPQPPSGLD